MNLNKDLIELYLKKVLFSGVGVSSEGTCDHRVGLLWYYFKAHRCPPVKKFFKTHNFLDIDIMGGGLTPEGQPLDKYTKKVFKCYFRDLYALYHLTATLNSKTGVPIAPTRQILSTWIVESWGKIPEELVSNTWTACGYIP